MTDSTSSPFAWVGPVGSVTRLRSPRLEPADLQAVEQSHRGKPCERVTTKASHDYCDVLPRIVHDEVVDIHVKEDAAEHGWNAGANARFARNESQPGVGRYAACQKHRDLARGGNVTRIQLHSGQDRAGRELNAGTELAAGVLAKAVVTTASSTVPKVRDTPVGACTLD